MYSEKATKFCEISTLRLTVCTVVRSKVEISQNFVTFSKYMNFKVGLQLQKYICWPRCANAFRAAQKATSFS